jgi:hypothetical protein
MSNIRLQYQHANGDWSDCNDRTDKFLDLCVKHNGLDANGDVVSAHNAVKNISLGQAIELLEGGHILRNHSEDWYSNCRSADAAEREQQKKNNEKRKQPKKPAIKWIGDE